MNRLMTAVRSALILADSSGSAIVREGLDREEWIKSAFEKVIDGQYIQNEVINPRIHQIQKEGKFSKWSDFQEAMDNLPSRVLLLSPCGSGKTLAAWRWIKAQLDKYPAARVIFLYPTRATATEGFRDYVSWGPEADVGLVHGTAAYDLEGLFEQPADERAGKDFSTQDRLYALGYWQRSVFSATVDQFLGFMQHSYRSICLLPLLADSVVVFDEVHSFDQSLFSVLKLFLKNFDVPVLCMTASLTQKRREDLVQNCGLTLFPEDEKEFSDLEIKADMPRYHIQSIEKDDAETIALTAYDSGQKVLWVTNTVARCQNIAKKLNALCYHSRFKLEDRKRQHQQVVYAFQKEQGSVLAITTQVCEMSLDLDADVLISEFAPVTAMIQRMGRCNRHSLPEDHRVGKVYFYPPEEDKPYSAADWKGSRSFLEALHNRTVSQKELQILLEQYGPAEIEVEKYAAFLESGPWAVSREESLRDTNDYTVNAVLDKDLLTYFEMKKEKQATDGLFVPVPKRFARMDKFPPTAPSIYYRPEFGFFDFPVEVIL
jgi:CRISPR-associated endonuclease/helicase Cas3